jgi:hypothetical protein
LSHIAKIMILLIITQKEKNKTLGCQNISKTYERFSYKKIISPNV